LLRSISGWEGNVEEGGEAKHVPFKLLRADVVFTTGRPSVGGRASINNKHIIRPLLAAGRGMLTMWMLSGKCVQGDISLF
jgi:hypothetical protein